MYGINLHLEKSQLCSFNIVLFKCFSIALLKYQCFNKKKTVLNSTTIQWRYEYFKILLDPLVEARVEPTIRKKILAVR